MKHQIKILDVVALLKDMPENKLKKGQVGTVVELLDDHVFEIEFSDKTGKALAILPIKDRNLLLLKYEMEVV